MNDKRLFLLVKTRGLKWIWLADKIGISPSHLSNIKAGRERLTEDNRRKLVKLLK
jgi:plasmid maintenance system antidote protein VapI